MQKNNEIIGEGVLLLKGHYHHLDIVAYHENSDIDVLKEGGKGIVTIGSGFWIDTRALSGTVDMIKDVFRQKGIKVSR